jgi:hypothetical protein
MFADKGIDVHKQVWTHLSALQLAKNFGHQDIVEILKKAEAKE